ncbi:MAG: hydroxyneurosporene dehydrogenase CrtC, partial [Pseudomonadota bacterium]
MRLNGFRPSLRIRPALRGASGDPAVIDTGRAADGLIEGLIRPSETDLPDPGPLPCGRRFAQPRPDAFNDRGGPRFDLPVPASGYAWWYIDAISDDGRHALTLIFFLGSVFSPYYAWARRGR